MMLNIFHMLVGHSSSFQKCLFRSLFVCVCGVYLCVCVCGVSIPLCVCVYICVCVRTRVSTQRSKSGVFHSFSPCILRQGPLLNLYLASLASLTDEQFPGSSCLPPSTEITGSSCFTWLLYEQGI